MLADGEYDAIVMGTGLKEAIMSGLLSTLGMKVNPVVSQKAWLPCARWPCCSVVPVSVLASLAQLGTAMYQVFQQLFVSCKLCNPGINSVLCPRRSVG